MGGDGKNGIEIDLGEIDCEDGRWEEMERMALR
jgi:hypothetical protein